jgi:ketosteroid isomerase-like protein
MADLRELTHQYVAAFNARDINGVAALLSEDFCLTDPSVTRLAPREKAVEYIHGLFRSNSLLKFEAMNILVDGDSSVIHFGLTLDGSIYHGIDLITWKKEKMSTMTAYLTVLSKSNEPTAQDEKVFSNPFQA